MGAGERRGWISVVRRGRHYRPEAPLAVGRDDETKDETIGAESTTVSPYDNTLPTVLPNGLHPHGIAIHLARLIPLAVESSVIDFKNNGEIRIHGQRNFTGRRIRCVVVNRDVLQNAGAYLAPAFHGQWAVRPAIGTHGSANVRSLVGRRRPCTESLDGLAVDG